MTERTTGLEIASYLTESEMWPDDGRHILAQFDDETIVVYQAYKPSIGRWAAKHGRFGGEFSFDRMSWIKPNFLWMMYRCGWAQKHDQETVLAVRVRREAFDQWLAEAVHSSYLADVYDSHDAWRERVRTSDVRLQWDPDHAPNGAKQKRRAIQLGLRGESLRAYGNAVVDIEDITDFVVDQRPWISDLERLRVPRERVYAVNDLDTRTKLELSQWET